MNIFEINKEGNIFAYMRISTAEERGMQKYSRQESALDKWADENNVQFWNNQKFKDDASGKSFDRNDWKGLEKLVHSGDTIVFKDLCRFTRECENGYKKYMELMNKGVDLIFIDNYTISTPYIKNMFSTAEKMENRIARKSLENIIELLLLVELDRAEQERLIISQRVKDGLKASGKKSGRPLGKCDKVTPELLADLDAYFKDRKITGKQLMEKHKLSRNTFRKYSQLYSDGKLTETVNKEYQ